MAEDIKIPLVSVVMPVYNGEQYLRAAIISVLSQTFKDFEFIIINDGSSDGSAEIINEYAKGGERIRVLNQTNHGLVYSLNRGIGVARGKYIARQDADDISLPQRLERELSWLQDHPDHVVVGSAYTEIDEANRTLRVKTMPSEDEEIRLTMYFAHVFAHGSVMMCRDALEKVGKYRQEYWPGEDLDLWRRLVMIGKAANLSEPLYQYRLNQAGISLSNLKNQQQKISKIHQELRRLPQFLTTNKNFLAYIATQDPRAYAIARQRTRSLIKQAVKNHQLAKANFLTTALRRRHVIKPHILMVSPTRWLGGGEVYTETIIKGLMDCYSFYLLSGKKLRKRTAGYAKKFPISPFPFTVKKLLKRTRPLEETYYRGTVSAPIQLSSIDLINIQAYEPSVLRTVGKQKNIPTVFTAHTRFPMTGKSECNFIRDSLRYIDKIICVSQAAQEDLTRIGIAPECCTVIHNGVDVQRFIPAKKAGSYITWIGRIESADKNPFLFVDIARQAKQANSSLLFRMVGEGGLVPRIKATIKEEQLSNLELTGFRDDTPQLYAQASVICLTSTSESLPLVILEAMSSGVPVVATNVGGVKEVISSPQLGTVLNSFKAQDFYAAIEDILSSKSEYTKLQKRVREHIVKNFSLDQTLTKTQDLFDRLLMGLK